MTQEGKKIDLDEEMKAADFEAENKQQVAEPEDTAPNKEDGNGGSDEVEQSGEASLELAELKKKCDEYLDLAQRTQASFQNYKKRTEFSVSEAYLSGKADTVSAFLAILDNLERACQAEAQSEVDSAVLKGVEMVTKQFAEIMKKFEVEKIPALGEAFDPNLHHAVLQEEADCEEKRNTVVQELQAGYRIGDKILRYSMVKVAQ